MSKVRSFREILAWAQLGRCVAAMLIGLLAGSAFADLSWNPEWGPPFKVFYVRQREYLFAVHGAVIGAMLGIISCYLADWGAKQTGRCRVQFSLAALLQMTLLIALILFCIRGYLTIRDATPYR